ncbi:MAG TPA: hypothetical protein VGH45_11945 [Solirubrobacteraceae bacterium]
MTSPTGPSSSSAIAISYRQPERIRKLGAVILSVSVAKPLTLRVRGTISLRGSAGLVRLVGVRVHVRPVARAVTVRLRVPHRRLKALRRALAKHRRLYASVQVNASDPASGSSYVLARRVALSR